MPNPPPPPPEPSGTAAAEADPVDFEALAAEQNHCAETQHLQAGVQRLVRDVSTSVFRPIVPEKFRKDINLGGWPLSALCLLGLSGMASPTTSTAGQNHA